MTSVSNLIVEFEKWLKKSRGMHSKQGISKTRSSIVSTAGKVLNSLLKDNPGLSKDNDSLISACKEELSKLDKEGRRNLNLLIEFFTENDDAQRTIEVENEGKESESNSSNEFSSTINRIIGRVALTIKSQAKATEFEFWSEDRKDLHIEVGSIVTVRGESEEGEVKIVGMATDMYATSATNSPIDDFYATGYGDPTVELPTARPVIKVTKVIVVHRNDGRFEPPMGSWPVYFATRDEIIEAYGADIAEEHAVLAGFTWDDKKKPVPINVDSRFLLGYEGAHVNITGASGLATKTSYALFLIFSVLSKTLSEEREGTQGETSAAVLFNVKEADLMRIDEGPNNIDELTNMTGDYDSLTRNLWNNCIEEGLDPFDLKSKITFYAPPSGENSKKPLTLRQSDRPTELFSYGLRDLTHSGGTALTSLFNPDDLDEKALALIWSIIDDVTHDGELYLKPKPNNFSDLLRALKTVQSSRAEWINIGYGLHHNATLNKITNRLSQAVTHQLKGLVLSKDGTGKPVPVENIRPSQIMVIDISKLHPKGQRLAFTQVYDTIYRLLEAKRNKESTFRLGTKEVDLKNFPDRVMVFVDELNKFAPSGRHEAALKSHIVDITARGRSIGLSLIGAEQVANQVDEELLANTSTFALGRTHSLSLKGDIFQWLQGGLKDKAMVLRKGDMILWHAVHSRPVIISFPKPIHVIEEYE